MQTFAVSLDVQVHLNCMAFETELVLLFEFAYAETEVALQLVSQLDPLNGYQPHVVASTVFQMRVDVLPVTDQVHLAFGLQ